MEKPPLAGVRILVLEDDHWEQKQLSEQLKALGANVLQAGSLREAREVLHKESLDLALLDIQLPDGVGLDLLEADSILNDIPVIFISSLDSVETAVSAIKAGATDYLIKPCHVGKVIQIFESWKENRKEKRRKDWIRQSGRWEDEKLFLGGGWGGLDQDLKRLVQAEVRLEANLPPVLITGETGTGKSTLARYLHRQGPRSMTPFVEVNASHLSAQLAASELFGHEKGAFTDARDKKIGLFEAADGGTLFLDEITQLDPNVQAKLLTVLENGTIRRLGGVKPIQIDVRLIVATNADPGAEVKSGRFREDLYHRLSLVQLHIPAIREHLEDLPELAKHLLDGLKQRYNRPEAKLTDNALKRIQAHQWSGNIRELRHELERALIFSDSADIDLPGLPEPWATRDRELDSASWLVPGWKIPKEGFFLETVEKTLIEMALQQTGDNLSAAARLLGIPRHVLRYRLQGKPRQNMTES